MLERLERFSLDELCDLTFRPKFSIIEKETIHELFVYLEPVEQLSVTLQSSQTHIGCVIPFVNGLMEKLKPMIWNEVIAPFHSSFIEQIKIRFQEYFQNLNVKSATFLDPEFKLNYFLDDREKVLSEVISFLKSRILPKIGELEIVQNDPLPVRSAFPAFMKQGMQNRISPNTELEMEVDRYLSSAGSNLAPGSFWSENRATFPVLSRMAFYFVHAPASSSDVERAFSSAKKIYSE